jgi:hypothetical protein
MGEREQIINYLLQACDQKTQVVTELQKKIADLEKKVAELTPQSTQA